MMIWKLYTETRPNLPELVARHFDAATLTPAIGLWRGKQEPSTVIEIATLTPANVQDPIAALARDIATTNGQESVLVSRAPAVVFSYDNREHPRVDTPGSDVAPSPATAPEQICGLVKQGFVRHKNRCKQLNCIHFDTPSRKVCSKCACTCGLADLLSRLTSRPGLTPVSAVV